LQDLQQRLLDQSVDDTRHAEFSDPAIFGISTRCHWPIACAISRLTLSGLRCLELVQFGYGPMA
jgi:hypothetical protein